MVKFKCTIKTSSRNREHKRKAFRLCVQGLAPSRPGAQWIKGRTKQWLARTQRVDPSSGLRKVQVQALGVRRLSRQDSKRKLLLSWLKQIPIIQGWKHIKFSSYHLLKVYSFPGTMLFGIYYLNSYNPSIWGFTLQGRKLKNKKIGKLSKL